jgi:chromosome segregation ATPase
MANESEDAKTKPTIETVLERINVLGSNLQGQLDLVHAEALSIRTECATLRSDVSSVKSDIGSIKSDVALLKGDVGSMKDDVASLKVDVGSLSHEFGGLRNEFQLFRGEMEIRIDRIDGMTNKTRSEMLELRADFREWKEQLKESIS